MDHHLSLGVLELILIFRLFGVPDLQNHPLVEELLNKKKALLAAIGVVSVSGDGYVYC
jgi:hypothetical protein